MRPLWISVRGGGNTVAQSIWRVQKERSPENLKAFLHKLRIYVITDQDRDQRTDFAISSHQWMRREFEKDLFFIWDEYATHIQNHGCLGRVYPKYKYGVEGDTPAFLYLTPVGLNNHEIPNQVGWGGNFEWGKGPDNKTYCYTNHQGLPYEISNAYQSYVYQATFNNFAARMDWANEGRGNRDPILILNGNQGFDISETHN